MRINLLKHRNMGLSTIVAAYPLQKEIMGNKYDITPETQERLDNDFTYHSPKEDQPGRYGEIRAEAKKLAEFVLGRTPSSREQSLFLTHLETAIFWANASIARNE